MKKKSQDEIILDVLLKYTQRDFSTRIPITGEGDIKDAIALGINTIGEELSEHIEEVERKEQETKALIESMQDGFSHCRIILNKKGEPVDWKFIYVNQAFENQTGLKRKDTIGKKISEILPGVLTDKADWLSRYGQVALTGKSDLFVDYSGPLEKWYEVSAYSPREQEFVAVFKDVTDRYIAQEEIRKSEQKFRKLLESAPDATVIVDGKGIITEANQQAVKMFGYSLKELLGKPVENLMPDSFAKSHHKHRANFAKKPRVRMMGEGRELLGKRKNGEEFPVEISLSPIESEEGILVSAAVRDVTERKIKEEEIKKSEQRFRKLLESAPDAMIIVNEKGTIQEANNQAVRLFGYKLKELLGEPVEKLMPSSFAKGHHKHRKKFAKNPRVRMMGEGRELLGKKKNGQEFPVEISLSPIETAGGLLVSAAIRDVSDRKRQDALIKEFNETLQTKNEELEAQQEELRQTNEELEEQTQRLKEQQEELKATNEELEEHQSMISNKNISLKLAKEQIEQKAIQLERSSKYKSEFLANMSHELRSPLNSMLILANDLAENSTGNLDSEQVESAEIIYKSGHELLDLINQILDLSKIEAGKMEVTIEPITISTIAEEIKNSFDRLASEKDIELEVIIAESAFSQIKSDRQRVKQIIINLVSNAIKFTNKGKVSVKFSAHNKEQLKISVSDTGIGIPKDKLKLIFEAFTQAEGGTTRKYGGTGLGLTIATQLTKMLGGEIEAESKVNKGSTFTILLPKELKSKNKTQPQITSVTDFAPKMDERYINYKTIPDDRKKIKPNDLLLLIIEDEEEFAKVLKKTAKEMDFKSLVAGSGEDGVLLAKKYKPTAIVLDMGLPGMSGEDVLNTLKNDEHLRKIPVHVVSAADKDDYGLLDIVQYLTKPVKIQDLRLAFEKIKRINQSPAKKILLVEDHSKTRKALKKMLTADEIEIFEADSVASAKKAIKENNPDCIILDLGLPDGSGSEIIEEFKNEDTLPGIIVYTGKDLKKEEVEEMNLWAKRVILKGESSEDRLKDEVALFLHHTSKKFMPIEQSDIPINKGVVERLKGKHVLLVDDDMRNVFALSKILKEKQMIVEKAVNGLKALEKLQSGPQPDIILMDIMMPEMDGYEAMKEIRKVKAWKKIPIIALTAKAMKGDKEKCIEAGANDYMAKPIDIKKLVNLMSVWVK